MSYRWPNISMKFPLTLQGLIASQGSVGGTLAARRSSFGGDHT
jgi:hypothetical protein